jgi:uncharacterized protein
MSDGEILDVHVHTELTGQWNEASGTWDTADAWRAAAGTLGIVGGITDSERPSPAAAGLGLGRCAVVRSPTFDLADLEGGLRDGRYVAVKINLGFMHCYASDERLRPIYELCAQTERPVLFHTGDPGWGYAKIKYAHPMTVDEVIVDHRKTRFVLVHAGNPWFETAAVIVDKNPNAYLEASSILEGDLAQQPPARVERHVIAPLRWIASYISRQDAIMFGSGWPSVNVTSYVEAYRRAIAREHWRRVFYETAAELFRISTCTR